MHFSPSLSEARGHAEVYTVAVIIPHFNGGPYIGRALENLKDETMVRDEVLIVANGSTEEDRQFARSIAAKHGVRLIRKANGGQRSAT